MYSDLEFLTAELPEDIMKLKWYGDFERAKRVIDLRLTKELPMALRKRLELEKVILERLPVHYIYTTEEATQMMRESIRDFREEELETLREEGAAEWIFIQGEVRYIDTFLDNLVKTRPNLANRLIGGNEDEEGRRKSELLNATIRKMKEEGCLAYRMQIKTTLKIKKAAERCGETIRVHLPIPMEYSQVKNFKLLHTSVEPLLVAPPDYPQRTVCFETELQQDQEFSVEYEFENHMSYVELKEEEVADIQPNFDTEEKLPHIRFTPYLRSLTAEVVGDEKNPLKKARRIYDYITTHVMYSFVRPYVAITDISGYVSTGLKGDCGIQALLFVTMCRCAGIPAKWQSGLYSTPLYIGGHDWAQFYIAPYGWLYADCSFGGSAHRAGAVERWDFYFGNLDPFRIPANAEYQQDLVPGKKFMREDPYDNQMGEAEYEDCGLLLGQDFETVHEVVKIEVL